MTKKSSMLKISEHLHPHFIRRGSWEKFSLNFGLVKSLCITPEILTYWIFSGSLDLKREKVENRSADPGNTIKNVGWRPLLAGPRGCAMTPITNIKPYIQPRANQMRRIPPSQLWRRRMKWKKEKEVSFENIHEIYLYSSTIGGHFTCRLCYMSPLFVAISEAFSFGYTNSPKDTP